MIVLTACKSCGAQWDVSDYHHPALRCRCGTLLLLKSDAQPVERKMSRCGMCRAPMAPEATRCDHCGAHVERDLTLLCPDCFAANPRRSKYCRACGLELNFLPVGQTAAGLCCPDCKLDLFDRDISGFSVGECPNCHGLWVRRADFEKLVNKVAESPESLSEQAVQPATPSAPAAAAYRQCPECKKLMNRRVFMQISRVVVDECGYHGRWLDAHELEQIATFLNTGGIRKLEEKLGLYEQHRKNLRDLDIAMPNNKPHTMYGVAAKAVMAVLFRMK